MSSKEIFQQKLKFAIECYQKGDSIAKSSKKAKIGSATLQIHLKKLKLSRSNKINSRKYDIDHTFFREIKTEEQAYWLGFLYADGYVTKNNNQKILGIALSSKDTKHLEKFLKATNSTYPIKKYWTKENNKYKSVQYSRVYVTSDQLYDDLKKHGVVERKTLILKYPLWISKKLENHFIRGYFDGDGSFSKATKLHMIKICGTKEFLNQILVVINKPNLKLEKRNKNKKNNYQLTIGGKKQIIEIANYLYKNSNVFLDRKYKIAKNYLVF